MEVQGPNGHAQDGREWEVQEARANCSVAGKLEPLYTISESRFPDPGPKLGPEPPDDWPDLIVTEKTIVPAQDHRNNL
jgi:hypothetical protein